MEKLIINIFIIGTTILLIGTNAMAAKGDSWQWVLAIAALILWKVNKKK